MTTSPDSWTAEHFAQNLPAGPGQDDVPALLRHVADTLESYGQLDVQDLVLHGHHEITEHGAWPSVTVYFRRPLMKLVPPALDSD
jgi:hypothetical protein